MSKLRGFMSENIHVFVLLLVLVTMTMCAGSNFIVGVLCICLCGMGFFIKEVKIDMKMFVLMMVMFGFASLSSMQTIGTPFSGYVSKWMLFLILYLWLGCLSEKESYVLRKYVVYWIAVVAGLSVLTFFVHAVTEGGGRLSVITMKKNMVCCLMKVCQHSVCSMVSQRWLERFRVACVISWKSMMTVLVIIQQLLMASRV